MTAPSTLQIAGRPNWWPVESRKVMVFRQTCGGAGPAKRVQAEDAVAGIVELVQATNRSLSRPRRQVRRERRTEAGAGAPAHGVLLAQQLAHQLLGAHPALVGHRGPPCRRSRQTDDLKPAVADARQRRG
jgi:hypothetical protein